MSATDSYQRFLEGKIRFEHACGFDIDPARVHPMLTLNGEQSKKGLEAHVCPLQFDIVDRLICRYSNPGELVFDPFGGLATVPYRALHNGRQGRCVELNTGYFLDGVKYLEAKERELSIPDMFATIEADQAKAA